MKSDNNVVLTIDTTKTESVEVGIVHQSIIYKETASSKTLKSQMVLPLIEKLLRSRRLSISDITDIEVHEGPGSFTGVRVGLSVANAIATLTGARINGKLALALPIYNT